MVSPIGITGLGARFSGPDPVSGVALLNPVLHPIELR